MLASGGLLDGSNSAAGGLDATTGLAGMSEQETEAIAAAASEAVLAAATELTAKIIDFGLAAVYDPDLTAPQGQLPRSRPPLWTERTWALDASSGGQSCGWDSLPSEGTHKMCSSCHA